ncbi:MAG TPA: carboxypeptidase regulatory-like domain-containing protein, partial [Gemmatimonadaceae bacterium]|nr:carboxypeptidase regulatory-like domain-containing protein [Gemmatimonadaceae bacterium]
AAAQVVRGTVVDQGRVPLAGVVVQLLDSRDSVAARSLSNERGEFRVQTASPGSYRLRTLRIGFRPTTSEAVIVAAGADVTRMLTLSGVAFNLDTVRVVSKNACRIPSDSATATFAVWEQARTALTAATLSARERSVSSRTIEFERLYDPGLRRKMHETARAHARFDHRAWRALPADALQRSGYIVVDRDGSTTYYGPDIDVLLSDEFSEDHCFRLVNDRNASMLGISFEPNRSRTEVPEIAGTLWLDRKTSELRHVEYRYVNAPRPVSEGNSGGGIRFARLRNGAWVITRWEIRMPVIERRIGTVSAGLPGSRSTSVDETYVREVRVAGGQLVFVARGSDTLWAHPRVGMSGVLTDSVSGKPVVGATIRLRSTPFTATSDSSGSFLFPALLPGDYTLLISTSKNPDHKPYEVFASIVDAPIDVRARVPTNAGRPERDR